MCVGGDFGVGRGRGGRCVVKLGQLGDAPIVTSMLLDGGELPGTPSTVLDLRDYADGGRWHVLREGALPAGAVGEILASL